MYLVENIVVNDLILKSFALYKFYNFFYICSPGQHAGDDQDLLHARPEVQQKGLGGSHEDGRGDGECSRL